MVSTSGFATGVLMGILAGLLNGIFLLPMRYARRWAWENVWLFFTILSTMVFPWVAAFVTVPHLLHAFRSVSFFDLVPGMVAGCVWGIAQVMYGLGCGMVGIAIGSAVIGCTAIISGTLGPLIVYAPSKLFSSAQLDVFFSVVRDRFDFVIVDSPPVLVVSDGLLLASHADGVILVAESRTSAPNRVSLALERLERVNAVVLGAVLNRGDIGEEYYPNRYGRPSTNGADTSEPPAADQLAPGIA